MNTTPPGPSAHLCPLCGQPNHCAMEAQRRGDKASQPCWCTQVSIPAELIERIPPEANGRACVCAACVRAGH